MSFVKFVKIRVRVEKWLSDYLVNINHSFRIFRNFSNLKYFLLIFKKEINHFPKHQ
jgi:hypothetical protein